MSRHISLFLLLFNISLDLAWPPEFETEEYLPVFKSFVHRHQPLHLQTHDRSIVDPFLPKTVRVRPSNTGHFSRDFQILNSFDFSEDNPFTDPAGVRGDISSKIFSKYFKIFHLIFAGLDSSLYHYLTFHVNPIGDSHTTNTRT